MTIKTIIAAIALENGEQQVARRAIRLAVDHGAKLVLAHAIESLPESDPDFPAPANEEAIANVLEAEAIASLKQMAESATVQTEIEVECGKADQFIERLIRDHAADLLVIGPGNPQNLRERIFGSTADRVVRNPQAASLRLASVVPRSVWGLRSARIIFVVSFAPCGRHDPLGREGVPGQPTRGLQERA